MVLIDFVTNEKGLAITSPDCSRRPNDRPLAGHRKTSLCSHSFVTVSSQKQKPKAKFFNTILNNELI